MSVITAYTDASHCPDTQYGGWACWVKYSKFETLQASGFFKEKTHDSTEAELKAIANALAVIAKRIRPENTIIVIVTDSEMARSYIAKSNRTPGKNSKYRAAWERKAALAKAVNDLIPSGCELRVNKVKAHSKSDGKRSYVNNLVDKAAYKKLQEARKKAA